jgi:hypothetical protein
MHGVARHRHHHHQQQNQPRPGPSSTIQQDPIHSKSYPRVPSTGANVRPLVSVQSEGETMRTRALTSRVLPRAGSGSSSIPPLPVTRDRREKQDSSDDESAGEEVIVRIDSPSTLTFHHASGTTLFPPHGNNQ